MLKAGKQFVTHVVPAVIKPIRILWNELIGFVFLVFATLCGFASWRSFNEGQAAGNPLILLLGALFSLMLLYYGWSSFRRAKKISRS